MKVLWHRVNETVELDLEDTLGEYRIRPYYYEIPVLREDLSEYLDYYTDKQLAVSLVIALRSEHDQYPELLSKRLFWMIKNLCERTDAKENYVEIVPSIDVALKDMFLPYADACNFPVDRVNWFDSEGDAGFLLKLEAMFDDVFRDKERVLHMDLAFHVGLHPTQRLLPLFERVKLLWRHNEPMATLGPLLKTLDHITPTPLTNRGDRLELVLRGMASYMGHSFEAEERYWRESELLYCVPGSLYGIHRHALDDDVFRAEIFELTRMTLQDEHAFACYFRKHNWTTIQVADLSKCFWWSGGFPESPHYKECSMVQAAHRSDPDYWKMWVSLHGGVV